MLTKRIVASIIIDSKIELNQSVIDNAAGLAKSYNDNGADEICLYYPTNSQPKFQRLLAGVARHIFVPLTVGGGMNTFEDFQLALEYGADKVLLDADAFKNPTLIRTAAHRYGDQSIVLLLNMVYDQDLGFKMQYNDGSLASENPLTIVRKAEEFGVGEIIAFSEVSPFDYALLDYLQSDITVPLIAVELGATPDEFYQLFTDKSFINGVIIDESYSRDKSKLPMLKDYLANKGLAIRI